MSGGVLVVDDERDLADSLVELLEFAGWRAEAAYSSRQAVEKMANGAYGTVLIDVNLPDRSGIATLGVILETCPDTTCVLMSGHSIEDLLAQGVDPGGIKVLAKPFDFGELHSLLTQDRDEARP